MFRTSFLTAVLGLFVAGAVLTGCDAATGDESYIKSEPIAVDTSVPDELRSCCDDPAGPKPEVAQSREVDQPGMPQQPESSEVEPVYAADSQCCEGDHPRPNVGGYNGHPVAEHDCAEGGCDMKVAAASDKADCDGTDCAKACCEKARCDKEKGDCDEDKACPTLAVSHEAEEAATCCGGDHGQSPVTDR